MKAQVSIELIFLIAILLIIFALVVASAMEKNRLSENMKTYLDKKGNCERFANEVEGVFILGNGAGGAVELNYNLTIMNNIAYSEGVFCDLCCNITKIGQSTFNLSKGWVYLKNRDDEITFRPTLIYAAIYNKPDHTFKKDITDKIRYIDGEENNIKKDDEVLHIEFDSPVKKDMFIMYLKCDDDGLIEIKEDGLGTMVGNATCSKKKWGWINITINSTGTTWDLNSDDTNVHYDYVDIK